MEEPRKKIPSLPFLEEELRFFKCPKLDAPLAQLSMKADLSFKDARLIRDQMDRKAEAFLLKTWDVNAAAMSPTIASSCVARNMDSWLERVSLYGMCLQVLQLKRSFSPFLLSARQSRTEQMPLQKQLELVPNLLSFLTPQGLCG